MVICTLEIYDHVDLQKRLVDVCVELGTVKRFIPNDWASTGVKGVRWLHDKVSCSGISWCRRVRRMSVDLSSFRRRN